MQSLRDRPIRTKLAIVTMMVVAGVLLPAFSALFGFQVYTLRQQSVHQLAVMGEMTAYNCGTAVLFKDEDASAQILGGLKAAPQVVSGRLELADRQRLAFFGTQRDDTEIQTANLK